MEGLGAGVDHADEEEGDGNPGRRMLAERYWSLRGGGGGVWLAYISWPWSSQKGVKFFRMPACLERRMASVQTRD